MSKEDTTRKEIIIDGSKIVYSQTGEGEIIILLHGITTYSFIWKNIIPSLAKHYNVIALDLLGCGESDKPLNKSYSLASHAQLIYKFVTQLGITKFHLVGHDLGGGIAQIFAVKYPQLLIDFTLINSVAYDFWPVQPIIAMRTPIIRQFAMATLDFGIFKLIVKRGVFNKERVDDEVMEYFWKPMKTPEGRKGFLHFAECLNNKNLTDISEELHNTELPLLVIRGDCDVYLSTQIASSLHGNIPRSKLVIIPNAGHFIQIDEPQLVANNLIEFYKN